MDIRKNRPENLAVLITSKNKKASAQLADAFFVLTESNADFLTYSLCVSSSGLNSNSSRIITFTSCMRLRALSLVKKT